MRKILGTIGSLRLTIAVVLAIIVFSIYGTFIKYEDALFSVYRSLPFTLLLVVFGLNLLACTLLRLKFRLTQVGFIATHVGVLFVLAGVIVGGIGGDRGSLNIQVGKISDGYYSSIRVNPKKVLSSLEFQLNAAGGSILKVDAHQAIFKIPNDTIGEFMHSLDKSISRKMLSATDKDITVRFVLDSKVIKKPLPFSIRLDSFSIDYYNLGEMIVTDREQKPIVSIPVIAGESTEVSGYKVTLGEVLPNFIIDSKTLIATTRNQLAQNPALHVSITKPGENDKEEKLWVFSQYPGMYESMRRGKEVLPFQIYYNYAGNVKTYKSRVSLLDEQGNVLKASDVKVNHPMSYKGFTIYQSSYDRETLRSSGLQVVTDPGLWVVYTGFILLSIGVLFIAYLKSYVRKKSKPVVAEKPVESPAG